MYTCLVFKNRILWDYPGTSHETQIEREGLNDQCSPPYFVRCKLVPREGTKIVYWKKWHYNLDDFYLSVRQDILPRWFILEDAEFQIKEAINNYWKDHKFEPEGER